MIGRVYAAYIASQAQTAAKTIVELAAPADAVVTVDRMAIGQTSFDTSENLGSTIQRITTTGTGTATTARPHSLGDPAYGGTVETNSTIEPTYDANGVVYEAGWNVLSGFLYTPANDDELIAISPSGLLGLNIDVAPSASMNFSYGVTFREIGG
jgi:hypothetical protein